jgi:RNHCP domain
LSRDQRTRARHRSPGTFRCGHCRLDVPMDAPGTRHRNHCPTCLWSRHLDDRIPGDRAAGCEGAMEPIAVSVRREGEWAIVHRCGACDTVHVNRVAGDDNPLSLVRLAVKPLAQPPFPLEMLSRL